MFTQAERENVNKFMVMLDRFEEAAITKAASGQPVHDEKAIDDEYKDSRFILIGFVASTLLRILGSEEK